MLRAKVVSISPKHKYMVMPDGSAPPGTVLSGTTGEILAYWEREENLDTVGLYIERRLRWPQTKRVFKTSDGLSPKETVDTESPKLVGLLSLVDVPLKGEGLVAIYEYIALDEGSGSRARVQVTKVPTGVPSFTVATVRTENREQREQMHKYLGLISAAMKQDFTATHRIPRNPSEAETAFFAQLRKG